MDRQRVGEYAALQRARGRTIVLTNGCFDVLHLGHVRYLEQARSLGDILIVGLNSDASVRVLKGSDRPVNPELDRAGVLGALSCVDSVVVFEEATPARLITEIRPDVYVKGGDYTAEALPERALVESLGGRVTTLDHVTGRSTTSLLARIRSAADVIE
jgi:D-beta-D-heptose 7-phosphate kinase/D-beta-D-heptose 1-phosphate adenosyltransferase